MKISGYEVEFPHQPYGVQLSFMSRVLQTIEHRQNALLEAPTGSGKTLSLLCSALSWQKRLKNEGYSEAWEGRKRNEKGGPHVRQAVKTEVTPEKPKVDCDASTAPSEGSTVPSPDGSSPDAPAKKRPSLPRIYYATRTHSQIGQVVRELKRAGYQPKMAILASRSHYCVHKGVQKKPNLDEECEALLEDKRCKFYNNAQKLYGMQTSSSLQVHDIEDLVKVGQSMQACPYFAARHFKENAELIFCPYNYLLDPVIRRAVQIDMEDAVIILDEAHNIEDICRDAASCELELSTLEDVQKGFEAACLGGAGHEIYGPLVDAVGRTAAWLRSRAQRPDVRQQQDAGQQRFEGVFGALELRTELDDAGLCPERVKLLWELYEKARAAEEEAREAPAAALVDAGALDEPVQPPASQGKGAKVGGFPLGVLSRLLTVLRLLYASDGNDYRLAVQRWWRTTTPVQGKGRRRGRRTAGVDDETSGWVVQLCLWSLNPAVAFRSVSESVRSVILASGTLSPLGSFASELAAEFAVRFEAPHVINARTQVWAGAIGAGPDRQNLSATFEQSKRPAFQDSLGASMVAIARVVPDGLLVFFSSYSMMKRLRERWETTGAWAQLQRTKELVCEPHGTGEAFDAAMKTYYDAIAEGRGAIFFAICRGKVSEGLDFTDANARAVVVVGIPFPNTKDTQVDLKKRYNDEQRRKGSRQLLSSTEWYTQQAFRALNQAIGRCIRHKHDYGGIILLDRRFGEVRNRENLSCWVKAAMNAHSDFNAALGDLTAFFARLKANPPSGKQPAAAPEQWIKSGAVQQSSAVGMSTRSGSRQPGSGAGTGGQAAESRVPDTAGSKAVASSQFATHSQPTLNAVWKNPTANLRKAERLPPAEKVAAKPAPVQAPPAPVAEDFAMPCSPAVSPPKPGEMPRTQTKGRGADAVSEAAWASSLSTSASSQQHASFPPPDQQSPAHVSSQNLPAWSPAVQPNSQAGQGQAAMHGDQAGNHGPSRFVPAHAEASLGQAPKLIGQNGHPGQFGHQGQSDAFSGKTVGPAAGMQAQGTGSPWSAQSNAQQRPPEHMHPNPEGKPQAGISGLPDSILGGPGQAFPAPALSTAQQRSLGSAPVKAAQRFMSRQHAHAKGEPVHVAPPAKAPNGQTRPSPNGASNWISGSPWPRQQPHISTAEHTAAAASNASEKTPRQKPHAGLVAQTPASVQGPLSMGGGYVPAHAHRPYKHQSPSPVPHSMPQQQPGGTGYMAGSAVRPQMRPSHGAGHMPAGACPPAQTPGHHGSSTAQPGPCHQQRPIAPRSQQPHYSSVPQQQARSGPQGAEQAPAAQHSQMQAGPFQLPSAAASIRNAASPAVSADTVTPQHVSRKGEPVPPQVMGDMQDGVVSGHSAQPLQYTAPPEFPHQQPQANSASSAPAARRHGPAELLPKSAEKSNGPPFCQRPSSMERVLLTDASGGAPHAAFKGGLPRGTLLAWVKSDVDAHLARLKQTSEEGDTDSEQLQVDAEDGVLDAFVHIREGLGDGQGLPELLRSWACPPLGLQVVETAFFAEDFHLFAGACSGHPELAQKAGLSHDALERLLVAAAGLGLEGALEEMLACYELGLGLLREADHGGDPSAYGSRFQQPTSHAAAPLPAEAGPQMPSSHHSLLGAPDGPGRAGQFSAWQVQESRAMKHSNISIAEAATAAAHDSAAGNVAGLHHEGAHGRPSEMQNAERGGPEEHSLEAVQPAGNSAKKPESQSHARDSRNFSNVSVVCDSGSDRSSSSNGKAWANQPGGSEGPLPAQQQPSGARPGDVNAKTKLGEQSCPENWPKGSKCTSPAQQLPHSGACARPSHVNPKTRLCEQSSSVDNHAHGVAGKVSGSGQKRQALSELEPQRVKHSQKGTQAWTQWTTDSDA